MRHWLLSFLHWLKDYANVLVALATLMYVVLTYRMLRALRRQSTRELRLRHLEDIKSQVVEPMLQWIESKAIPVLKGEQNLVFVTSAPIQREKVALGEPVFDFRRELAVQINPGDARRGHLFVHARDIHFRKELSAAEFLIAELDGFLSDCLALAKNWADEMASATTLVRGPASTQEFADSDYFAALSLKCLAGQVSPQLRVNVPAPGGLEIFDSYTSTQIARGPTEVTRSWHENAWKVAREGWQGSGFARRLKELLTEAALVGELVSRLRLTYDLKGDCEYIGGRDPGRVKRLWQRLTHA